MRSHSEKPQMDKKYIVYSRGCDSRNLSPFVELVYLVLLSCWIAFCSVSYLTNNPNKTIMEASNIMATRGNKGFMFVAKDRGTLRASQAVGA